MKIRRSFLNRYWLSRRHKVQSTHVVHWAKFLGGRGRRRERERERERGRREREREEKRGGGMDVGLLILNLSGNNNCVGVAWLKLIKPATNTKQINWRYTDYYDDDWLDAAWN